MQSAIERSMNGNVNTGDDIAIKGNEKCPIQYVYVERGRVTAISK